MNNKLRTFHEWSNDGYKIKKGSRHVDRNEAGECLFNKDQVEKFVAPRYQRGDPHAGDDEFVEVHGEDGLDGNPADYGDR